MPCPNLAWKPWGFASGIGAYAHLTYMNSIIGTQQRERGKKLSSMDDRSKNTFNISDSLLRFPKHFFIAL